MSNVTSAVKSIREVIETAWRNDFIKVLVIFLISRLFIYLLGFIANITFFNPSMNLLDLSLIWDRFDVGFYRSIAENGYEIREYSGDTQANWGFMPLYPTTVGIFLKFIPISFFNLASILSNIFSFSAIYILFETLKNRLGENKTQFLVAYLFSAGSFYLSIPYNESLYILLIAIVFYFTKKEYYFLAFLFTGFAVITRLQSLALLAIPGFAFLLAANVSWKNKIWRSLVYSVVFILPIALFMLYLRQITGNPLAFIQIQSAWENPDPYPFRAFFDIIGPQISFASIAHFFMWVPFWFLIARNYNKMPVNELLFCLGVIIISTSTHQFYGAYRYTLALIPVYIILNHEKPWIQKLFLNIQIATSILFIFAFIGSNFLAI